MEKLQQQNRRLGLMKRIQTVKKQESLLEYSDTFNAQSDSQKSFDHSEQRLDDMLNHHENSRSKSQALDPILQEFYMTHLDVLGLDLQEKQADLTTKTEEHKQSAEELAHNTVKLKTFEKFENEIKQEIYAEAVKKEMLDLSRENAPKGETI